MLLALALACGGLAAAQVSDRLERAERRTGPLVPVVAAARDLEAGKEIGRGALAVAEVPARYAPPDAIGDPAAVVGARPAVATVRGAYVTASLLGAGAGPRGAGGTLRRGERAVEVPVAGGPPSSDPAAFGPRVDVVVSTEPRSGSGRSFLALEDVELLAFRPGGGVAGERPERADGVATLRVTVRQAVYLTAAGNYAREVRLLPRPAGDRGRAGAVRATGDL
jgi:pilus assembly protein CpaB